MGKTSNRYPPAVIEQVVRMAESGTRHREIYDSYFHRLYPETSLDTFCRDIRYWRRKMTADEELLDAANLAYKFTPHGSTVRINAKGEIVEAWIKQHTKEDMERLLDVIRDNTPPAPIGARSWADSSGMLELPLFDLHFGVADLEYYRPALEELLGLIRSKHWKRIVVIIGQDLLHNDDMRGRTSKGTQIEQVDIPKAWADARAFWYSIIDTALEQSEGVRIIYSKGNHDESLSWAFCQMLQERYGAEIVDDGLDQWKAYSWERVFIGISHGDKGPAKKPAELVALYATKYPVLWSEATVREIHLGHLHTEMDADPPGARVRRLGSGNKPDKWSDDNGFLGGQNRFMVFEWAPGRLRSIHYI